MLIDYYGSSDSKPAYTQRPCNFPSSFYFDNTFFKITFDLYIIFITFDGLCKFFCIFYNVPHNVLLSINNL